MSAVYEQRRRQYRRARDLVSPARLPAALAEDDRRVVGVPCEPPGKGKRGVEGRPGLHAPMLEAEDPFTRHLVRPGTRLPGGLVRAVEIDHQVKLGGITQDRLIEIDDLSGFMVEEIDLETDHAGALQR